MPNIADEIRETAASVAWIQWTALGSMASSRKRATSVVDPEALLLLSLAFREHEARLADILRSWLPVGLGLISVQRIKNLARAFPESTREALRGFAAMAVNEGKDARWKSIAGRQPSIITRGRRKEWKVRDGGLIEASTLMLRLRLGFGVGLRADALTYLLSQSPTWFAVRPVAKALCYTEAATRRALDGLAAARMIHQTAGDQPTTYFASTRAWYDVLEISEQPRWRNWFPVFALFAQLDDWWMAAEQHTVTEYAADILLRKKLARHRTAFGGLVSNDSPAKWDKLGISDLKNLTTWALDSV